MAKKMLSNKERIQKKFEDIKALSEKRTGKKKKVKKKAPRKRAVVVQRMKVVWKVFNSRYKELGCFSYQEKKKAEKMAEMLEKKNKDKHYVNAVKVKMLVEG